MNYELEITEMNNHISARTFHLHMNQTDYMKCHFHEYLELVYLIKGSLVAYVDGQQEYVNENQVYLISPYLIHYFEMKEDCEMITMLLSYEDMRRYESNIMYKQFHLSKDQSLLEHIKDIMISVDCIRKSSDQYKDILIQKNIYELFYILLTNMSQDSQYSIHESYQNVQQIIEYLEDHYNHHISFQKLSQQFGYSHSYLCRYFKKVTNMSLLQFQKSIQLKHAYIDVCYSRYDMTQIALIHGFPSVQNFIKLFKKEYQLTPYVYRKQLGQK